MTAPSRRALTPELVGRGLACRRGGRLVFAGLDFCLPAAGALVLTGSNGSGKSSLLRLLAMLLRPAAGQLLLGGAAIDEEPAAYRAMVRYLGHLDAATAALTPRENLRFWGALGGSSPCDPEPALECFGLGPLADWPCRWLSAGQRRRLALARLLVSPAPIWLLDEPTAALDQDGCDRLLAAIAEHRAAGGRVAIATHHPLALRGATTIRLDEHAPVPEHAYAVAAW